MTLHYKCWNLINWKAINAVEFKINRQEVRFTICFQFIEHLVFKANLSRYFNLILHKISFLVSVHILLHCNSKALLYALVLLFVQDEENHHQRFSSGDESLTSKRWLCRWVGMIENYNIAVMKKQLRWSRFDMDGFRTFKWR